VLNKLSKFIASKVCQCSKPIAGLGKRNNAIDKRFNAPLNEKLKLNDLISKENDQSRLDDLKKECTATI
jgi:hypothetical protein